jgi:hypothetical protein
MQNSNLLTVPSYLPFFSGFYNTAFSADDSLYEYERENGLSDSDYTFDSKSYEKDVCERFSALLPNFVPFIVKCEYETVISPKYYNYTNDSCNVQITFDVEKINAFVIENKAEIIDYYNKNGNKYRRKWGYLDSFKSFIYPSFISAEYSDEFINELLSGILEAADDNDDFLQFVCDFFAFKHGDLENNIWCDIDIYADSFCTVIAD